MSVLSEIDRIEEFWEDFLPLVEERRVVPVIGPGLLTVTHEGAQVALYELVARKLADKLRVPLDPDATPTLNDVVCRYVQRHGRREEIYPRVRAILKDLPVEPPPVLRALARITDFELFVSLSFDALLAQALNAERYGGREATDQIAYAPNKVADLPASRRGVAAVYSLFGKVSVGPDFVVTDEDTLEFIHALQSDGKRPHLLFDALQASHLVLLGCGFPDWLTRFFMRTAKGRQLSVQRGEAEWLVDDRAADDTALVYFLENFSYGTRILPLPPATFVTELEARWSARRPAPVVAPVAPVAPAAAAAVAEDLPPDLPAGGVFLSYASEDTEAVRRIHRALDELGIEVWFDRDRLEAGDQYDAKIKRSIKACSLFLPIISRNTERRLEGYFRREWKLAEDRSLSIAEQIPFLLPIVIDDTPPYDSVVPEAFQKAQWTKLPGGEMQPEFQMRVVKLVRDFRRREKGLA